MPADTDPSHARKRLFIEHLAERMQAMETGKTAVHAVAYRLYAKRLGAAAAGVTDRELARMTGAHAAVAALIADRHFETHGRLPGPYGRSARSAVEQLIQRLRSQTA